MGGKGYIIRSLKQIINAYLDRCESSLVRWREQSELPRPIRRFSNCGGLSRMIIMYEIMCHNCMYRPIVK